MGKTVGFIGLGTMGLHMAGRLAKAGFSMIVCDIDKTRGDRLVSEGARFEPDPGEVASCSTVIISMLPYPGITEKVILGKVTDLLGPGKVYIDMSTSSLAVTKKIYEAVKARGGDMLDAPVSGGEKGAMDGTLTIMVGGDKKTFDDCGEIFACLGRSIYHIGGVGSGLSMKLVNNLLYSSLMCATAEVLTLGETLGLDFNKMAEIFGKSSASSYAISNKTVNYIIPDKFTPGFSTSLLLKDIDLALEMSKDSKVPLFISTLSRQMFQIAMNYSLGNQDNSSIIKVYKKMLDSSYELK